MTTHDETLSLGSRTGTGAPAVPLPRADEEATKLTTLAAMPLFEGVSTKQLKVVAGLIGLERRPAGAVLLREGVEDGIVLVLAHGFATASKQGRALGVAGPSDLLGDPSQLRNRTSVMTYTCDTDVVLLTATPQVVREVFALLPQTYVRLTSTSEEIEALEAQVPEQDWSWLSGLVAMALFLAVITGAVFVAGSFGAFQ